MFKKLCDNLNKLMDEAHISADELARRTGLPASTIKKIRNRCNPNPTLTTLLPLAQYFSLTLSQLVGDDVLPQGRIKGIYKPNNATMQQLPVIRWEEAVRWPKKKGNSGASVSTENRYGADAYALMVEENDWENLTLGTALLVDPGLKAVHRDFVVVWKTGQEKATLKQLLEDEGERYLKPVVEGYSITSLTNRHNILGVVVEYKKNLKQII